MIFDPNMTKKKKKKKKPFMLDEEGGEGVGGEEAKEVETKEAEPEAGEDKELDLDDDESRKKGQREKKNLRENTLKKVWTCIGCVCPVLSRVCLIFSEPSDDLNDLNFFNQKKKKKKSKKVFDNDIEESLKVWRNIFFPSLFCAVATCLWFY